MLRRDSCRRKRHDLLHQNGGDSWTKGDFPNTSARAKQCVRFFSPKAKIFGMGIQASSCSSLNSGRNLSYHQFRHHRIFKWSLFHLFPDSALYPLGIRELGLAMLAILGLHLTPGSNVDWKGLVFQIKDCYAAGELGTVLKNDCGGVNWSKLNSTVISTLRKVCNLNFWNARSSISCGESATAIRSTNSGIEFFLKFNLRPH